MNKINLGLDQVARNVGNIHLFGNAQVILNCNYLLSMTCSVLYHERIFPAVDFWIEIVLLVFVMAPYNRISEAWRISVVMKVSIYDDFQRYRQISNKTSH